MSTKNTQVPEKQPSKLWVRVLIAVVSAVIGALGYGSI